MMLDGFAVILVDTRVTPKVVMSRLKCVRSYSGYHLRGNACDVDLVGASEDGVLSSLYFSFPIVYYRF